MSKEQLDDAKKKTNLNVDLVGATATLPDISATTPKVSLFEFQSAGQELITAGVQQTEKFSSIAATKAGFMKTNQERADSTIKFTPCVVLNATGVRLSLVKPFTGLPDYPAPALIEPGECASFLAPGETGTFTYEVQVFEGPFAIPGGQGGWQAPDKAGDPLRSVSIKPFALKYSVAEKLNYGDKIKLVNQFDPAKGYLDTYGDNGNIPSPPAPKPKTPARGVGFGVQTTSNPNRDSGLDSSSTWEIVRDDADNPGSGLVNYGDKIKLVNQFGAKGYLDTYGDNGTNTGFGVQTTSSPNRDGASGTWQIVRDNLTSGSGPVTYGDKIKLVNQFEIDSAKGYLDTLGANGTNTGFGVQTSSNSKRNGGSGTWQLIPSFIPNAATSSVSPSNAPAFVEDTKIPSKLFETTLVWTTNGQALPVNQFKLTQSGGEGAARIKTKAGLGFEATIAPNTTSGLTDKTALQVDLCSSGQCLIGFVFRLITSVTCICPPVWRVEGETRTTRGAVTAHRTPGTTILTADRRRS
eukprot:scaffold75402_cov68-Phaeocystis_antarctica.AAC.5